MLFRSVFFSLLNFFFIFLEFCITCRVGTKRNDNFYFLSLSVFSTYFGFISSNKGIFLIFLELSMKGRIGNDRKDNSYFLSFMVSSPILGGNEAIMVLLNFLNFLAIFFGFFCNALGRNRKKP